MNVDWKQIRILVETKLGQVISDEEWKYTESYTKRKLKWTDNIQHYVTFGKDYFSLIAVDVYKRNQQSRESWVLNKCVESELRERQITLDEILV